MTKLRITEIFYSVQGEGCLVGTPMTFIRLFGCSVKCKFCDTDYSWNDDRNDIKDLSIDEIVKKIHRPLGDTKPLWVCITGGEPTEQNILPLLERLKDLDFMVALETNGRKFDQETLEQVDWITISPKNGHYDKKFDLHASEMKLIIEGHEDLENLSLPKSIDFPVFLQPVSNNKEVAVMILNYCLMNPRYRLGFQLHKIINFK